MPVCCIVLSSCCISLSCFSVSCTSFEQHFFILFLLIIFSHYLVWHFIFRLISTANLLTILTQWYIWNNLPYLSDAIIELSCYDFNLQSIFSNLRFSFSFTHLFTYIQITYTKRKVSKKWKFPWYKGLDLRLQCCA